MADAMDCDELVELVTAYLDGALPAAERARIDAHLDICEGCDAYVEQLRTTARLAGRITPADISPDLRNALAGAFRDWQAGRV